MNLDDLSRFVIFLTIVTTMGVAWMWSLFISQENRRPWSRLLLVLCVKSSLIMVALWVLSWLAKRRLDGEPTLGDLGGFILVFVILVLASAHLITIGYLFAVRIGKIKPPGGLTSHGTMGAQEDGR